MFLTRLLNQKLSKIIKTNNTAKVLINSGAIPLQVIPIDIHKYNNGDHCIIEYELKDRNSAKKEDKIREQDKLDQPVININGKFINVTDKNNPVHVKELKVHVPIFSDILTVQAENKGQKISIENIEPTKLKVHIGEQKHEKWEKRMDEMLIDKKNLHSYTASIESGQRKRVGINPTNKPFRQGQDKSFSNVTLKNIKALRSITVKSMHSPIDLQTIKSIQTMRLSTTIPHPDSSINFTDTVKVRILDVEAGEIKADKSVYLKQGVIQSNRGDIDLKSVDSNSVLGVTSAQNLFIREIEGQGEMTFNAQEYMNVWLSPTVKNVNLNSRKGTIDLFTADSLKGQMVLDVPTKAELRLRQLALINPNYSLADGNIQKRHMHVDRRIIIDLGQNLEQKQESNNEEEETLEDPVKKIREKTDLYQGKVTRSSKNDLSKELLNREEKIDPNFQPTKIHAIADYISIDSMSWMKATFRKIEYEKPSALNHIIKDEKRKKELVTAHEEHFLFRS